MRVTFVCPPNSLAGGMRVIALYTRKLAQRGHEIEVVFTDRPRPSRKRRALNWILRKPITRLVFDDHYFEGLPCTQLSHSGPVVDKEVPDSDVVVATYWRTAPWVAALPPSKGAKAYFMQDYGTPGQPLEGLIPTWRLPLHIITIAPWLVRLIRQHVDRPVDLVENAVDTMLFHAAPRGRQQVPTVGFVYQALHTKGADICLAAIERAKRSLPTLRTHLIGTAPGDDVPLPMGVRYLGRVPEDTLRNVYAGCDAWLFPSRLEGFGLPILEAMACRTPVIGTPAGAAPELIGHGGGILVPHEDPPAMAEAIVRVCTMPEERWRSLSNVAYQTATNYTWDDAADRFEAALYKAVELQRCARGSGVAVHGGTA